MDNFNLSKGMEDYFGEFSMKDCHKGVLSSIMMAVCKQH